MFRSARLKLTFFYLAALLVFSLAMTFAFRTFADAEYGHSNHDQNADVRRLFDDYDMQGPPPSSNFADFQAAEATAWQIHLDHDLAKIDVIALVFGGLLCYWYAGRTLKPIEEAHEAQKRFVADASHELRTPLTNLRLENEVFLRQKNFSEAEARELIVSNLEEVQRLQQLSSNLLDLTQYGHASLKLGSVGMAHIAETAAKQAHAAAEAKGVRIVREVPEATALGDHDSLVQLLCILLDNAVKYGPDGSTVTVKGARHGGQFVLQVLDEGGGIDQKDLPHIFERLYRGDKARSSKAGGYGLGLSLAQEIAHANRAHLTARNNADGKGACFEVRLEIA
ncbi:MAG TPA: ATP-binding protein [Candidatus Saccharimonadales bacterium]